MNIVQLREIALVCARRLSVLAVSVTLALISLLPIEKGGLVVAAAPMVALSILVFWMLAYPKDVSAGSMFLNGLIFDAFGGGPLGLWALGYVVACLAMRLQREDILMMPRLVVLMVYATVAGLAGGTVWGTATVYVQGFVDPMPLITGGIVSAGTFLVALLLFGSRAANAGRISGAGVMR